MPLKVLICHEMPIVRDGLRSVLGSEPDIDVVDATRQEIQSTVLVHRPDVVITGLTADGGLGLYGPGRPLGAVDPPPRVVAFSVDAAGERAAEALRAGAIGVLTGEAGREDVIATVRAAARGETMLTPAVTQRLVDWFRQAAPGPPRRADAALTERERQVLLLIAQGRSTEEVARELYIGVSTVRTHLHRLRTKLKLRDRGQLVSFAYRAGLLPARPEHAGSSAS